MKIFEILEKHDYEQLVFCQDKESGLKAIIAIHDTTLGPALGGTRMWPYHNEEEAITDVLRLSRGMTYKSSAAGLNLGGGKAVIIGDPKKDKSEALFRAYGRFIESLGGRYITAEDVGTSVEDMNIIYEETKYVTGRSPEQGSGGDPSPVTAYGVYKGLKATAFTRFGTDSLEGKTVAVQGLGHVGYHLCESLHKDGASLVVADINTDNVKRVVENFGAVAVPVEDIYSVDCDIFAPCALGGILNDLTIPQLKCKAIAGAANNQLQNESNGQQLFDLNILYAPDYLINAGGIINVYDEFEGYDRERAFKRVEIIYDNLLKVFEASEKEQIPTNKAADKIAEERIIKAKQAK